jgi:calcium/proton exchanger cax
MAKTSGLTTEFLSVVLLPLAGNAVEHITAVMVALKNKMDLALGIAIGSSLQIALFVLPTCVLASWGMGNDFSLNIDGMGAHHLVRCIECLQAFHCDLVAVNSPCLLGSARTSAGQLCDAF